MKCRQFCRTKDTIMSWQLWKLATLASCMYIKYNKKIQVKGKSYVYYPNFPVFHQKYRNPGFSRSARIPVFPGFPGSRHHVNSHDNGPGINSRLLRIFKIRDHFYGIALSHITLRDIRGSGFHISAAEGGWCNPNFRRRRLVNFGKTGGLTPKTACFGKIEPTESFWTHL